MPHDGAVWLETRKPDYAFLRVFSDLDTGVSPNLPTRFGGAKLAGRFAAKLFEHAIKLRQRLKSDSERDLADAKIDIVEETARFFETDSRDVIDEVDASDFFEFFAQVIRADVRGFGHLAERKFFRRMFLDELARLPNLDRLGASTIFDCRLERVGRYHLFDPHHTSTAAGDSDAPHPLAILYPKLFPRARGPIFRRAIFAKQNATHGEQEKITRATLNKTRGSYGISDHNRSSSRCRAVCRDRRWLCEPAGMVNGPIVSVDSLRAGAFNELVGRRKGR